MGVYKILFNGNSKEVVKDTKAIAKNLKSIQKEAEKSKKVFKSWVSKSPFGAMQDQADKFKSFMSPAMNKVGGSIKGLGKPFRVFKAGFGAAKSNGLSTTKALMQGFKAFGNVAKVGLAGATKGVLVFGTALWSTLWPIGAIMAGIFLLKKAWQVNMGGIQTTFNKIFGKVKKVWAEFNIAFVKILKSSGGIFKSLFSMIGGMVMSLLPVFKALGGLVLTILKVLMPVGAILMTAVFLPLALIFKVLAPILTLLINIVKFGLMPIVIVANILTFAFMGIVKLFKWLAKSKAFKPTLDMLKWIGNLWKKIKSNFMNFQDTMPGWLKKVLGIEAIEFKDSPSAKGDSNSTTNNNNNDNRNISIMTNKEVDKKGAGGLASIIQEQSFVGV